MTVDPQPHAAPRDGEATRWRQFLASVAPNPRVLTLIVPRGKSLEDHARYMDVRQATPLSESEGSVYTVRVEAMK